jgi:hypothetical protein
MIMICVWFFYTVAKKIAVVLWYMTLFYKEEPKDVNNKS